MSNRINYKLYGWILDDDAAPTYRSHINGWQLNNGNCWLSAPAHNTKTGESGLVWWYWPKDRRHLEDGADWVRDWSKCNDIEVF